MTILAPTGAPPKRHLDAASDVADDFRPREPATEPRAPSLRIVHLGKYFHPAHGGIERMVRSLAHAQARLGCSVRVICMDHERGRATRVEQDGPVEVVRLRRAASFCKIDHCPDLPKAAPRFRGRPAAPAHPEPVDDPRADALGRSQAAGGEPLQRRRQATSASGALQSDRTGLLRPGTADPVGVAALHSRLSRAAALSRPGGRPADRPGSCPIPGPGARGQWRIAIA